MRTLILTALLATTTSAAMAQDMVLATAPDVVAAQMQDAGLKAKIGTDGQGDPMISSATAGVNFDVFFYDCAGGKDCGSIQLNSCFDLAKGLDHTAMNTWNYEMRYGKASVNDEGDPCLKMDIDMTAGVTAQTFAHSLDTWSQILGKFVKDIGY
jgi:Putative bacterial sensory transduction regulator